MSAIGELNQRVTFQQEVRVDDAGGGAALSWQDVATVWARVESRSGRERVVAQGLESSVAVRMTIRHRTGITAGMRALLGARRFLLEAVFDPDGGKEFLEIVAVETPAA